MCFALSASARRARAKKMADSDPVLSKDELEICKNPGLVRPELKQYGCVTHDPDPTHPSRHITLVNASAGVLPTLPLHTIHASP